jgi:SAM-dependent methyltransferase
MKALLQRNRQKINKDLKDPHQRKLFSPVNYASHIITVPAILKYACGKLIDIGCGDMPYQTILPASVTQYDTIDVERRVPEVKFQSDIHNMTMFSDESYDTAICLEVLEHVPNPFTALAEIARILKRDAHLILSVPHLSRLHEEPHDYFRYTHYGLQSMLADSGFRILEIKSRGGLFCFLGHQFSTCFLCPIWHIPLIKQIFFFINTWLCVKFCYFLDTIFDKQKIFAAGYTVIAQKH